MPAEFNISSLAKFVCLSVGAILSCYKRWWFCQWWPPVHFPADLQIGSGMPKPDLGSLYAGLQSSTQIPNPYGAATTHCTLTLATPQLRDLASQSSCVSGYPHYSYASTPYSPITPVSPQYFHSTPPSLTNSRALPHRQQDAFAPPIRSCPSDQSFVASAYPNSSNYTVSRPH